MGLSTPPATTILGEKAFTDRDQRDFASASGDWNPMHVDAIAARRLLSGRQVVHGIHTLIHALNLWSGRGAPGRLRVSCTFANPVNVGDTCVFCQVDEADGRTRITAMVDGLACTEVMIEPAQDSGVPDRGQSLTVLNWPVSECATSPDRSTSRPVRRLAD